MSVPFSAALALQKGERMQIVRKRRKAKCMAWFAIICCLGVVVVCLLIRFFENPVGSIYAWVWCREKGCLSSIKLLSETKTGREIENLTVMKKSMVIVVVFYFFFSFSSSACRSSSKKFSLLFSLFSFLVSTSVSFSSVASLSFGSVRIGLLCFLHAWARMYLWLECATTAACHLGSPGPDRVQLPSFFSRHFYAVVVWSLAFHVPF